MFDSCQVLKNSLAETGVESWEKNNVSFLPSTFQYVNEDSLTNMCVGVAVCGCVAVLWLYLKLFFIAIK